MDEPTATAQSPWLAQNEAMTQGAVDAGQLEEDVLQDRGAIDYATDGQGADDESSALSSRDEAAPVPTPEAASAGSNAGKAPAKDPVADQAVMDTPSTPPPPLYGADGPEAIPPPPQDIEGSALPQSAAMPEGIPTDGPQHEQPSVDSPISTTGVPESDTNTPTELPLGILPILFVAVAALVGLFVYRTRRGKNWNEISETIHSEGSGVTQPESRIATQFSEIHDLNETPHTQHSRQTSHFD